jgi:hypothetical protein
VEPLDVGDRTVQICPPLAAPGLTDHEPRAAPARYGLPRPDEDERAHVRPGPQWGEADRIVDAADHELADTSDHRKGEGSADIDQAGHVPIRRRAQLGDDRRSDGTGVRSLDGDPVEIDEVDAASVGPVSHSVVAQLLTSEPQLDHPVARPPRWTTAPCAFDVKPRLSQFDHRTHRERRPAGGGPAIDAQRKPTGELQEPQPPVSLHVDHCVMGFEGRVVDLSRSADSPDYRTAWVHLQRSTGIGARHDAQPGDGTVSHARLSASMTEEGKTIRTRLEKRP